MNKRAAIKKALLEKTLSHVPFDGWSAAVLECAAKDLKLDPSYAWRLFPQGPIQAISYWSELLDQKMLSSLPSGEELRVRDRVALAVKTRILLLAPTREAARKTAAFLARPMHLSTASRLLYQTANEIWYYAGDTSTDYNFYTKRTLLMGVYASTFMYWLKDESPDYEKTWAFLEKRIENVLTLPKIPHKIAQRAFFWRRRDS